MKRFSSNPLLDESLAPNGAPVKDNFAAWFGDSKVVDTQGQPLVVHHGTASDFSVFDTGRGAIYFADDLEAAQAYADNSEHGDGMPRVVHAYLRIENPKVIDHAWAKEHMADEKGVIDWTVLDEFAYEAEQEGHDGMILRHLPDFAGMDGDRRIEREYDQYIVFNPVQIKSASANSGLYLKDSPDMNDRTAALTWAPSCEPKTEGEGVPKTFGDWFSDSQLVDENQQPLVFYHGTTALFDSLKPGENGLIFVSPDSACAEEFGGRLASGGEGLRIVPLFVRAKRAFDASVHAGEIESGIDVDQLVRELSEFSRSDWTPQGALAWVRRGEWQALEQPETLKAIRAAGFDAMWVHEMGMRSLAVFDADQLRPAIGNPAETLNWNRAEQAQKAIKTMAHKGRNDEKIALVG